MEFTLVSRSSERSEEEILRLLHTFRMTEGEGLAMIEGRRACNDRIACITAALSGTDVCPLLSVMINSDSFWRCCFENIGY